MTRTILKTWTVLRWLLLLLLLMANRPACDGDPPTLKCGPVILTVSLGHCHPAVVDAVVEQSKTLGHPSTL